MRRPEVVLCDLDGTITDSYPGIERCLRHALPTIGLGHLTDADIRAFLGPPLHYTLKEVYGKSDEDVERFVATYRAEYFHGGEYEFEVFDGMAEFLADIAASDMRLVLATAKPIESAERVLRQADLIDHFDFVSGSELDLMRQGKALVIAHGMESIGLDIPGTSAVMIGDRKEDVLGAQHYGFPSIGVLWGYGSEEELRDAGATHLAAHPRDMRALISL